MACYFPFKGEEGIPFQCGKCPYCLQRRANDWVFKCIQEAKVSISAHWCTFTYVQPNITEKGFMTIDKTSLQKFFKRLRKKYPETHPKIKYYAVGEYGTKTLRPHYHAIIFNAHREDILEAWTGVYGETENGLVHFDLVNENTVMYTTKYMMKSKKVPLFEGDDRIPEFQLFSKGLGISYLSKQVIEWHKADPTRLYVTVDGFKKALPRYFRLKIYDELERQKQAEYAQQKANEEYDRQYKQYKKSKSKGQTFEEFRFSRKKNAIKAFHEHLSQRDKL